MPVPPRLQRFVDLPGSPDIDEIKNIATNVVTEAGATTPYAKAEALRNWFRDGQPLPVRHDGRHHRQRAGHPRVPEQPAWVLRAVRQRRTR